MLKVVESTLITKMTIDKDRLAVLRGEKPSGITETTFAEMDVVSAPLRGFDDHVFADGLRERSGALRMNAVEVVDVFGFVRSWKSVNPATADDPAGSEAWRYWTELTPRLPYWSRLLFRLQSAADATVEATPGDSPVCGILMPDYLEHTLEVFDADGSAIGELRSDRPAFGAAPGTQLAVHFALHPWVAASHAGDPLSAIHDDTLKAFVASVLAQPSTLLPTNPGWYETGLTAMLRVVDTIRGTLDPSKRSGERIARLYGEPIVLLRTRLSIEATSPDSISDLTGSPAPLPATPALPGVRVRIGDVTRPDDGVLGCFLAATGPDGTPAPALGRFAPVSRLAAERAVLNTVWEEIDLKDVKEGQAVRHPFIRDQVSEFTIVPNAPEPLDLVVLADPRGSLYATCGALPRKAIMLPKELLDPVLARLEPSFRVGPVLTTRRSGVAKPFLPPPAVDGMVAEFVYESLPADAAAKPFGEIRAARTAGRGASQRTGDARPWLVADEPPAGLTPAGLERRRAPLQPSRNSRSSSLPSDVRTDSG